MQRAPGLGVDAADLLAQLLAQRVEARVDKPARRRRRLSSGVVESNNKCNNECICENGSACVQARVIALTASGRDSLGAPGRAS